MDRDQKNLVSHRGKATRAMIEHFLKEKNKEIKESKNEALENSA